MSKKPAKKKPTAKKTPPKTPAKAAPKARPQTLKDLVIRLLSVAPDDVEGIVRNIRPNKLKPLDECLALYGVAEGSLIRELVRKHTKVTPRGRTMPRAGDTRTYRAQQVGDGGVFLRLPLEALGAAKGNIVSVSFQVDRIVTTLG